MMKLRTPLTELIGIEHPVVQTGMGWGAGARLVAATSNAGGLGILASATMTLDELAVAIGKVKAATDKPFGVNIRADAGDADRRGVGIGLEPGDQLLEIGRRQSLAADDQERLGGKLRDRLEIGHEIELQRI